MYILEFSKELVARTVVLFSKVDFFMKNEMVKINFQSTKLIKQEF